WVRRLVPLGSAPPAFPWFPPSPWFRWVRRLLPFSVPSLPLVPLGPAPPAFLPFPLPLVRWVGAPAFLPPCPWFRWVRRPPAFLPFPPCPWFRWVRRLLPFFRSLPALVRWVRRLLPSSVPSLPLVPLGPAPPAFFFLVVGRPFFRSLPALGSVGLFFPPWFGAPPAFLPFPPCPGSVGFRWVRRLLPSPFPPCPWSVGSALVPSPAPPPFLGSVPALVPFGSGRPAFPGFPGPLAWAPRAPPAAPWFPPSSASPPSLRLARRLLASPPCRPLLSPPLPLWGPSSVPGCAPPRSRPSSGRPPPLGLLVPPLPLCLLRAVRPGWRPRLPRSASLGGPAGPPGAAPLGRSLPRAVPPCLRCSLGVLAPRLPPRLAVSPRCGGLRARPVRAFPALSPACCRGGAPPALRRLGAARLALFFLFPGRPPRARARGRAVLSRPRSWFSPPRARSSLPFPPSRGPGAASRLPLSGFAAAGAPLAPSPVPRAPRGLGLCLPGALLAAPRSPPPLLRAARRVARRPVASWVGSCRCVAPLWVALRLSPVWGVSFAVASRSAACGRCGARGPRSPASARFGFPRVALGLLRGFLFSAGWGVAPSGPRRCPWPPSLARWPLLASAPSCAALAVPCGLRVRRLVPCPAVLRRVSVCASSPVVRLLALLLSWRPVLWLRAPGCPAASWAASPPRAVASAASWLPRAPPARLLLRCGRLVFCSAAAGPPLWPSAASALRPPRVALGVSAPGRSLVAPARRPLLVSPLPPCLSPSPLVCPVCPCAWLLPSVLVSLLSLPPWLSVVLLALLPALPSCLLAGLSFFAPPPRPRFFGASSSFSPRLPFRRRWFLPFLPSPVSLVGSRPPLLFPGPAPSGSLPARAPAPRLPLSGRPPARPSPSCFRAVVPSSPPGLLSWPWPAPLSLSSRGPLAGPSGARRRGPSRSPRVSSVVAVPSLVVASWAWFGGRAFGRVLSAGSFPCGARACLSGCVRAPWLFLCPLRVFPAGVRLSPSPGLLASAFGFLLLVSRAAVLLLGLVGGLRLSRPRCLLGFLPASLLRPPLPRLFSFLPPPVRGSPLLRSVVVLPVPLPPRARALSFLPRSALLRPPVFGSRGASGRPAAPSRPCRPGPPGVAPAASFASPGALPGPPSSGLPACALFLASLGGGAWPFFVGGVLCLVPSAPAAPFVCSLVGLPLVGFPFFARLLPPRARRLRPSRSVLPFAVLGRPRAPLLAAARLPLGRPARVLLCPFSCWGLSFVLLGPARGLPRPRPSSACVASVPALCPPRPSLLPLAWL
ncbi:hypothetical protein BCR33DRAFT_800968, partial [Rhizoclosmatium globosum]